MTRTLVDVLSRGRDREVIKSWDQVAQGAQPKARAPHVATRAQVESEGSELVAELYKRFDEYNAAHFEGKLAAPLIVMTMTSPRALADACERDENGLRSIIRVHPSTFRKGELFCADVLLHEMVHVWQFEIGGDRELGYRGHGPRFAEKCNEIGRRLSLPPVSAKGRKGLPDCAAWPVNVREGGYYRSPAAEKEREKRSTRRKPATPDDAGEVLEDLVDREFAPCHVCGEPAVIELSCIRTRDGRRVATTSCGEHGKVAVLAMFNAFEIARLETETSSAPTPRLPPPPDRPRSRSHNGAAR